MKHTQNLNHKKEYIILDYINITLYYIILYYIILYERNVSTQNEEIALRRAICSKTILMNNLRNTSCVEKKSNMMKKKTFLAKD